LKEFHISSPDMSRTRTGGPSLSVTIVARNEERTIANVLAAAAEVADEIILLDSGSTDSTVQIAQHFGVRVYHQPWLGYAEQKNKALELARGDWILSLDADEVMSPGLLNEIRDTLRAGVPREVDGFKLPRVLYIGNTAVRRGGFYPDAQLRLIRNGRGRFRPRVVHESIAVEGRVLQLKNDLLHYAYQDVDQFAETMDEYARLSARHYFQQGQRWRSNRLNELLHPWWTLFYRQVVRGGMFGGPLCRRLNHVYADYVRKKVRYLRELEQGGSG
jgi:glycosyltransferase involved in cell wall biosynthesis